MAERNNKDKVSNQISVFKNNKGVLETQNCLKPSPRLFPWHIHASGKEEGYSRIRLVALNYSEDQDEKAVSVYANLKPEEVKFLLMKLCFGFENVDFEQQKIFRTGRGEEGTVTILSIKRSEFEENGKRRNIPWSVEIHNGTGIVKKNRMGGQYCKAKSYEETGRAKIFLDDLAFFELLSRTCVVISAFEHKHLYREREIRNFQNLFLMIKRELEEQFERAPYDQRRYKEAA